MSEEDYFLDHVRSIHGLNHALIAQKNKNRRRAAAWAAMFVIMVVVYASYMAEQFQEYFRYDVQTVLVLSHDDFPFPAVTVCNQNPIKQSDLGNFKTLSALQAAYARANKGSVSSKESRVKRQTPATSTTTTQPVTTSNGTATTANGTATTAAGSNECTVPAVVGGIPSVAVGSSIATDETVTYSSEPGYLRTANWTLKCLGNDTLDPAEAIFSPISCPTGFTDGSIGYKCFKLAAATTYAAGVAECTTAGAMTFALPDNQEENDYLYTTFVDPAGKHLLISIDDTITEGTWEVTTLNGDPRVPASAFHIDQFFFFPDNACPGQTDADYVVMETNAVVDGIWGDYHEDCVDTGMFGTIFVCQTVVNFCTVTEFGGATPRDLPVNAQIAAGDTVSYISYVGYVIKSNGTLTCQPDGTFDPVEPEVESCCRFYGMSGMRPEGMLDLYFNKVEFSSVGSSSWTDVTNMCEAMTGMWGKGGKLWLPESQTEMDRVMQYVSSLWPEENVTDNYPELWKVWIDVDDSPHKDKFIDSDGNVIYQVGATDNQFANWEAGYPDPAGGTYYGMVYYNTNDDVYYWNDVITTEERLDYIVCEFTECIPNNFVTSSPLNSTTTVHHKAGEAVQYGPAAGYRIVGTDTLTCMKGGDWEPTYPETEVCCQYVQQGNTYYYIDNAQTFTWDEATAYCEGQTYQGITGRLFLPKSQAEEDFILGELDRFWTFESNQYFWIDLNSEDPADPSSGVSVFTNNEGIEIYRFDVNSTGYYTNWLNGNPLYAPGMLTYVAVENTPNGDGTFTWNWIDKNEGLDGPFSATYIVCEFVSGCTVPAFPNVHPTITSGLTVGELIPPPNLASYAADDGFYITADYALTCFASGLFVPAEPKVDACFRWFQGLAGQWYYIRKTACTSGNDGTYSTVRNYCEASNNNGTTGALIMPKSAEEQALITDTIAALWGANTDDTFYIDLTDAVAEGVYVTSMDEVLQGTDYAPWFGGTYPQPDNRDGLQHYVRVIYREELVGVPPPIWGWDDTEIDKVATYIVCEFPAPNCTLPVVPSYVESNATSLELAHNSAVTYNLISNIWFIEVDTLVCQPNGTLLPPEPVIEACCRMHQASSGDYNGMKYYINKQEYEPDVPYWTYTTAKQFCEDKGWKLFLPKSAAEEASLLTKMIELWPRFTGVWSFWLDLSDAVENGVMLDSDGLLIYNISNPATGQYYSPAWLQPAGEPDSISKDYVRGVMRNQDVSTIGWYASSLTDMTNYIICEMTDRCYVPTITGANPSVTGMQIAGSGTVVRYTTDIGYTIASVNDDMMCNSTGQWSPSVPVVDVCCRFYLPPSSTVWYSLDKVAYTGTGGSWLEQKTYCESKTHQGMGGKLYLPTSQAQQDYITNHMVNLWSLDWNDPESAMYRIWIDLNDADQSDYFVDSFGTLIYQNNGPDTGLFTNWDTLQPSGINRAGEAENHVMMMYDGTGWLWNDAASNADVLFSVCEFSVDPSSTSTTSTSSTSSTTSAATGSTTSAATTISTAASTSPYVPTGPLPDPNWSYEGCLDFGGDFLLGDRVNFPSIYKLALLDTVYAWGWDEITSVTACLNYCFEYGHMYAGVTDGNLCFCGNQLANTTSVDPSLCLTPCTDTTSQPCDTIGCPADCGAAGCCGGEQTYAVYTNPTVTNGVNTTTQSLEPQSWLEPLPNDYSVPACFMEPCGRTGVCKSSPTSTDGYECECLDGYAGDNCETNIDDCAASPCGKGEECVDGIAKFTCFDDDFEQLVDQLEGLLTEHPGASNLTEDENSASASSVALGLLPYALSGQVVGANNFDITDARQYASMVFEFCTSAVDGIDGCAELFDNFYFDAQYGFCFTYNSDHLTASNTSRSGVAETALDVIIDTLNEEYLDVIDRTGPVVALHRPGVPPFFPDAAVYYLPSGMDTEMALEMESHNILNTPYSEYGCHVHIDDVNTYFYDGHYSASGCDRSRLQKKIMHQCGCASPLYGLPEYEIAKICDITDAYCADGVTFKHVLDNVTDEVCAASCYSSFYRASLSYSRWPREQQEANLPYYMASKTRFRLYIPHPAYSMLVERPAFPFGQLISSIGSLGGICIGCSMLSVVELIMWFMDK